MQRRIVLYSVLLFLVSVNSAICQLYVADLILTQNTDDNSINYEDVEIESSFNILYAVELGDGKKVVLGEYYATNSTTGSSTGIPDSFVNVFLDENNLITKTTRGGSNRNCGTIIYATALETNQILIIGDRGQAFLTNNADLTGFGSSFCNNEIFEFGNYNYDISRTTKVVKNNNFLTVLSQATDSNGISGTLQTIIDIAKYEQINNFFTPLPSNGTSLHKMTGLEYISHDTLVVSYSSNGSSPLDRDFLCFMDRQRNLLSTLELPSDIRINDMILDDQKNIVLAGDSNDFAHIMVIDFDGNILWQKRDTIDIATSTLVSNTYNKVLLSQNNEFILSTLNRGQVATIVTLSCLVQDSNISSSAIFGQYPYGYGFRDLYYTDKGSLFFLTNYIHTGAYYGYFFNCEIRKSTTVSTNELEKDEPILTYPNPFSNQLHITLPQEFKAQTTTYQLLDMQGRLINQGPYQPTLNTSTLSSGSYILRLSDQEKTYSHTINCSH